MKISCNTMLYDRISNQMPKNAKFAAFVVNVVNFSSLTRLHITCLVPQKLGAAETHHLHACGKG